MFYLLLTWSQIPDEFSGCPEVVDEGRDIGEVEIVAAELVEFTIGNPTGIASGSVPWTWRRIFGIRGTAFVNEIPKTSLNDHGLHSAWSATDFGRGTRKLKKLLLIVQLHTSLVVEE